MTKKNKFTLFIFLAMDVALVVFCIWLVFTPSLPFGNVALFNPKGIVAQKEGQLILTAVLIMLIGIIPVYVLVFLFAWKYREGKTGAKYSPNLESNWAGGAVLWAFPAAVIFTLSVINWKSTHELDPTVALTSTLPPLTIQVVALEWKFLFIYPQQNIATVNFIEFPVNTPVHFELTADAPMSSFWIPQLGSQIFAMAAMQTQLNLMANTLGDFRGLDTEINGAGFSGMKFVARSASQSDFDTWVQSVKSSSDTLNLNVYNNLALPSQNNPRAYYAPVDPGLYDTIMMKNMMPMTQEQMQQMSSFGMDATSSPTMDMEGMNMSSSSPMQMPGMDMPGMGQSPASQ